MVLAARAGYVEQIGFAQGGRSAQHRSGDAGRIGGQAGDQPARRRRGVGHALGELGADLFLHLGGKLAQHVIEQARHFGGVLGGVAGEEEVGHLAQQLAPTRAGGLVGERDQVVDFARTLDASVGELSPSPAWTACVAARALAAAALALILAVWALVCGGGRVGGSARSPPPVSARNCGDRLTGGATGGLPAAGQRVKKGWASGCSIGSGWTPYSRATE